MSYKHNAGDNASDWILVTANCRYYCRMYLVELIRFMFEASEVKVYYPNGFKGFFVISNVNV